MPYTILILERRIEMALTGYPNEVAGEFKEKEFGNWFHFSPAHDDTPFPGFDRMVWVGHDEIRWAKVNKTFVSIVVDEGEEAGVPIVERWELVGRKVNFYPGAAA